MFLHPDIYIFLTSFSFKHDVTGNLLEETLPVKPLNASLAAHLWDFSQLPFRKSWWRFSHSWSPLVITLTLKSTLWAIYGAGEESALLHRRARLLLLLPLRPLSTLLSDTKTFSNQFNVFPGLERGLYSSETGLCDGMPSWVSCLPPHPRLFHSSSLHRSQDLVLPRPKDSCSL